MTQMQNTTANTLANMSKRDQQLYCTWEDVDSVWTYLKQSNALANLNEQDWLIEDHEPALEALFSLDATSAAYQDTHTDEISRQTNAIVHPEIMNQWALKFLTRDAWRTVKKGYARHKYNQKNRIFKVDVKDDTRRKLLAVKDELGFASYDEVLQYQQQYITELKQQLAQLKKQEVNKETQEERVTPPAPVTGEHIQLSDKQRLVQQATFVTDELLTQHLIERLPNDYRSAITVVIKNLFCEGYLQAKSDKQRTVRKMQEHLETNTYLKQLRVE